MHFVLLVERKTHTEELPVIDVVTGPQRCVKLLHDRTESLTVSGYLRTKGQVANLSASLITDIAESCPNLKTLHIQDCYYNAKDINLEIFPQSVENLSLQNCEAINLPSDRSYFKNISTSLPKLKSLNLNGCGWVKNHCLMAICKAENLEELSVVGCFRIGECFAYTALATRFGFTALRGLTSHPDCVQVRV